MLSLIEKQRHSQNTKPVAAKLKVPTSRLFTFLFCPYNDRPPEEVNPPLTKHRCHKPTIF